MLVLQCSLICLLFSVMASGVGAARERAGASASAASPREGRQATQASEAFRPRQGGKERERHTRPRAADRTTSPVSPC
jgi:hypothetical protein